MKLKNNKSGFTLLEIIIVIIIVGVLASLALPRFFRTVEFSRSTEAVNTLGSMKRAADNCSMMGGGAQNYTTCTTFNALGMDDPGVSPGAHFCYTIAYAAPNLTMTGKRNSADGGDGAGDYTDTVSCTAGAGSTITFTLNTTTGVLTKAGTGPFSGIR